jgi:two-component system, NarL family, nitrate/nitrite response regulator NarL
MSAAKKKITILLADDHPVVRKGLWSCLANKENLKVVGEAADGVETIHKVRELAPDIVLMDLAMPKMDGVAVTETLRREAPEVKVLILSMHRNRETVLRVLQAGARGYVLKDSPPEELVRAIEAVNEGEAFLSPEVARFALNEFVSSVNPAAPLARLSEREREVLALIAEGKSNKEIANHLSIGVRTAETHRERIMRKLDIHTVAGLTKFAITHGLVSLDESLKP